MDGTSILEPELYACNESSEYANEAHSSHSDCVDAHTLQGSHNLDDGPVCNQILYPPHLLPVAKQ